MHKKVKQMEDEEGITSTGILTKGLIIKNISRLVKEGCTNQ